MNQGGLFAIPRSKTMPSIKIDSLNGSGRSFEVAMSIEEPGVDLVSYLDFPAKKTISIDLCGTLRSIPIIYPSLTSFSFTGVLRSTSSKCPKPIP